MIRSPLKSLILLSTLLAAPTLACQHTDKKKDKEDKATEAPAEGGDPADPHANLPAEQAPHPEAPADQPPFSCAVEKTPREFLGAMTQDLYRRAATPDELKAADDPAFDKTKAIEAALKSPEAETGVAYFASNLLRIQANLKDDPDERDAEKISLMSDLRQEPVVLIQRNRDLPWSTVFTTQDIYCTSRTGALYGFPVDKTISGFVSCKLPPERAGLLGTVSFLRAFSSAYYTTNNNRHRVAIALYLAQGIQLSAKTDGPKGEGRPIPLAACVPEVDNRIGTSGNVFGTAAVPKVGLTCSNCHSRYLGPMEPAFVRFGPQGETLEITDVDRFDDDAIQGIDRGVLKDILMYGNKSCWTPNELTSPPQDYTGLPGLARLIGSSPKLGFALAVQIQQNLVNRAPDDSATASIQASYEANGKSLNAALRGFFLSPSYGCAKAGP